MRRIFIGLLLVAGLCFNCKKKDQAKPEYNIGLPQPVEFVFVKGGTFQMGDTFGDEFGSTKGTFNEKPVHRVTVHDFYLAKHEVTVAQYQAFCHETGRKMPDPPSWGWQGNHPMVYVGWDDASAFCRHYGYRLPTEAEWEFAARGGGKKVRFGNGKNIANPAEINFNGYTDDKQSYYVYGAWREKTTPVGTFSPNDLGLYDMSGNVRERCADWYEDYGSTSQTDPQGPDSGSYHVLRGGSWGDRAEYIRCSYRSRYNPNCDGDFIGFRPAKQLK